MLSYISRVKSSLERCEACREITQHPTRPETLIVKTAYEKPKKVDLTYFPTTALFSTAYLIFEGYLPAKPDENIKEKYWKLKKFQCELGWSNGNPIFKKHRELDYISKLKPINYDNQLASKLESDEKLVKSLLSLRPKPVKIEIPRINFEIILYDGIIPSERIQVGDYYDYFDQRDIHRVSYPYIKNPSEIKWLLYLRLPMVNPFEKIDKTLSASFEVLYQASTIIEEFTGKY